MFEVAFASEYHGYAILIGTFHRILVTDTAAGLYDGRNTILSRQRNRIVEGKETV